MRIFELTLQSKVQAEYNKVRFLSPLQLLLTGFKLSYVSPEAFEEQIYEFCNLDLRFKNNVKNNCLEEGLLNFPDNNFVVETDDYQLMASSGPK